MKPFDAKAWGWTPQSSLFVLTGAGISAESGIKTFRDAGGLWEGQRIEDVASPAGFRRNPDLVIDFYNQRRAQLDQVSPNLAHSQLAELVGTIMGLGRFTLVTQNVDDLHERAGSPAVIHMHGELRRLRCLGEVSHHMEFSGRQTPDLTCPTCGADLRPDIVWFGEMPYHMNFIHERLMECTHFVAIGTSSMVYPAAGFKQIARANGAVTLNINPVVDMDDPDTDLFIREPATSGVARLAADILACEKGMAG